MQQSGVRNTAKCNVSIMRACMLRRLYLKGKDDASLHLFSMQGKTVKVARRNPKTWYWYRYRSTSGEGMLEQGKNAKLLPTMPRLYGNEGERLPRG